LSTGTGLTGGGDLSADRTFSVDFAASGVSSSTKAVRADDSRLSDARTPTAHTHAISDVTNLQTSLDGKAAASHTHAISDVTNLQTTLDGKAAASHTHAAGDITSGTLNIARIPTGTSSSTVCIGNDSRLSDARTPLAHTHVIGDVTNLQTSLDGKAASVHTHAISDVTGLQTALDGKAATSHVHSAADVTSGTFNIARIPTGTTSSTVCIGNDSRLSDARTPLAHTHVISDVTNLQTTLDGKAASSHTHVATDISNSTSVGRNVLTAADAAAARSAISVPTIYSGTTTPSSGLGADGDLYFKY
jgi:oxalate decarboxylase/phosphoglucose isomerase-like protein (cupin superfamily)